MNIYLVRHGEDEDNAAGILNGRRDTPLTALGQKQAETTAEQLHSLVQDVDILYSSPLQRALRTAEIIAQEFEQPVVIEKALIERDFGVLTGKPRVDIPKYSAANIEVDGLLYFLGAKDAESFESTYARAEAFLTSVKRKNYNDVIMVAHRDICVMIQAAFYGWTWEQGIRQAHMENAGILQLHD